MLGAENITQPLSFRSLSSSGNDTYMLKNNYLLAAIIYTMKEKYNE